MKTRANPYQESCWEGVALPFEDQVEYDNDPDGRKKKKERGENQNEGRKARESLVLAMVRERYSLSPQKKVR